MTDLQPVRRIGTRPTTVIPATAQQHLDTVERLLERHRIRGSISPAERDAALDHLKAARKKIGAEERV